ncbi:SRPBCC family protein [Methylophaga sp.]|uniref:SRPBCC family protein n=1 Tax=Methylophaga sp. TaxID=2024840 RepID=UPI002727ECD3|nr:SRPBCC family protein [Methylophaga sp.]MDO8827846.1 SRPBCC family protein [Methylophaga sp.]
MNIQNVPIATTAMLIRKPVSEVFEAFVNPAITAKFWFTKGSGRLQVGKQIRWDWEMYNISVQVSVKAIEDNKRILIEWGAVGEKPTTVEWVFTSRSDNTTFVSVTNSGFSGDGDEIVSQALDSTGGFALVLAGAKAYLEHNISLNLIADRFPDRP